ncbi:hypothetical protein TRFO_21228 [Tritrichomonas foetus]|uniref:Sas10 C-terminal domain-containing protein n=1 Tax=Tritrichomonas foetus TaxID=1144522 RepID=A0A1J4KFB8_9EUKA|nr:hypothetical protein TRFO_21228 [Tritrichomonas foetus]|eukprot:OHT09722.1 hypothetical protein TRFO_21228 [Tritrichomonas foetus]
MKKGRTKKNQKKSWDRKAEEDQQNIPVMQVNTKWGNDRSLYFDGEGDSGTSSDEEHFIEDAIEEERKHLSTLDESSFKLFSNVKKIEKTPILDQSIDDIEKSINEDQMNELRRVVRSVVRDVTDAARALQEDFSDSEADQARRQLLFSLVTNGCFYLHLVGNGLKQPNHPTLKQMKKINELLGIEGNDGEVHPEEEEGDENEADEAEEDEISLPEKHIPVHLRKIEDGEYRTVTRSILKNQIIAPNKPNRSKAPRSKRRQKYAHAMHEYNKTHKRKTAPKDGVYRGEISGISKTKVSSTKLHPAH